jgi:thioredoxin 1
MSVLELDADNFQNTITGNATVIIDFWAPWCAPCRAFAPTFEAVSAQHPDIVFAKINTEEQQSIAAAFNIRSIPTLMVFRDQIIIYAEAGALSSSTFEQLIGEVMNLNMDTVRQEIATQMHDIGST